MRIVAVALSLGACGDSFSEPQRSFNAAVRTKYGEDLRIEHSFFRDSLHVLFLIDGEIFRQIADSVVPERAEEVAMLALEHWDPQLTSDSLTIRFVRFLPGAGASYCAARSVTFWLPRIATEPVLRPAFVRLNISRTPCPD